jgi:hypothetical protein
LDGGGISDPSELISEDPFNNIVAGSDGKLFSPPGAGGGSPMLQFRVEDGHLMLYTNSTSEASRFSINEYGDLIYSFVNMKGGDDADGDDD